MYAWKSFRRSTVGSLSWVIVRASAIVATIATFGVFADTAYSGNAIPKGKQDEANALVSFVREGFPFPSVNSSKSGPTIYFRRGNTTHLRIYGVAGAGDQDRIIDLVRKSGSKKAVAITFMDAEKWIEEGNGRRRRSGEKMLREVTVSGSGLAQGGHIDCAGSDKQAVLRIPTPADKLARVSCTKWGHIIQPVVNWIWTLPGGYRPVFFPAQMVVRKPTPVGNNDYFVEISVRELPASESIEKWKFIAAAIPGQAPPDLRSLEILAKNRKGQSHTVYLFNSGWGYGCSPKCAKEAIFLIVNKEKQKVSW